MVWFVSLIKIIPFTFGANPQARPGLVPPMCLMIHRTGLWVRRQSVVIIGDGRYILQIEESWHWTFAFAVLLTVPLRTCLLQRFSAL